MAIVVHNLSFSFGQEPVVEDLDFKVSNSEIVGIIGANGAGKSTIVKLLSKVLKPESGAIAIDENELDSLSRMGLARLLAVVSQISELPESFTVEEIVMMGRTPHIGFLASETKKDYEIVEKVMARTDVLKFKSRLLGSLSGGEKQRVVLARALAQEPRYLLLDEPTNHLDLNHSIELMRLIKQEVKNGLGVLLIMHDLNLASRVCDRLLVLESGKIVGQGNTNEVISKTLIRNVFGAEVAIYKAPNDNTKIIIPKI